MVNQLKAGVMLSYVSQAATMLTGLLYTPIMLRLLGQSEYGLYQLSASVISYFSLLSMGFGSSYIRYYSRYKVMNDTEGIRKLNGMFMSVFIAMAIVCVLAGSVLVFNVDKIFGNSLTTYELNTSRILMAFMILNLAISFPGSVFSGYITANEQYIFQRIVNILNGILNPFLTLPLLLIGYKSIAMVVIQTVLSLTAFVVNWGFSVKRIDMSFSFKNFNFGLLREVFMFSFWIFLNQIINMLNNQVDKIILGMYCGTIEVAIYGVGYQLVNMLVTFSSSISGVFVPRINMLVAESDNNKLITELFTKVGRIQFILIFLLVSGLIIFGPYFINIWAGEGYENAYIIVLLLAIPGTVQWIQTLGIEIQRAKNKHQIRSIVYLVMAIFNVIVSIPLAKRYGAIGATMGTCATYVLGYCIAVNIIYKKIGIDIYYFWKSILSFVRGLIIPIITGVLIFNFVNFNSILQFCIWIVAYTLIYAVSMRLWGMNEYEKNLINGIVNVIKQKIEKQN